MSRLFGERVYPHAPGYQPHSATSEQAAASITPKLGDLHRRVWAHIKASGGCTDEELIEALSLSPSTVRPRRVELAAQGYVEDSGHTKRGRSGRSATIWRVTGKDRAE